MVAHINTVCVLNDPISSCESLVKHSWQTALVKQAWIRNLHLGERIQAEDGLCATGLLVLSSEDLNFILQGHWS